MTLTQQDINNIIDACTTFLEATNYSKDKAMQTLRADYQRNGFKLTDEVDAFFSTVMNCIINRELVKK